MVECHKQNRKIYAEGTKLKYVPFHQFQLKTILSDYVFPVSPVSKNKKFTDLLFYLLLRDELKLTVTLTNVDIHKHIFP